MNFSQEFIVNLKEIIFSIWQEDIYIYIYIYISYVSSKNFKKQMSISYEL